TVEGLAFLAYPTDRAAYGRLCRLISAGRMSTLDGEWQAKGVCEISLAMLAEHAEGVQLILLPPRDLDAELTIEVESNVVPFPAPGHEVLRDASSGRRSAAPQPLLRMSGNEEVSAHPEERLSGAPQARSRRLVSKDACELTAPFPELLPHLARRLPTLRHLAASYLYTG